MTGGAVTWNVGNLEGLIPLFGGLYAYLMAKGIVLGSKNPEKMIAWRNRFGPMLKIVGPSLMVWGLIVLSGILNGRPA